MRVKPGQALNPKGKSRNMQGLVAGSKVHASLLGLIRRQQDSSKRLAD